MIAGGLKEHLEGDAVADVLAGMDLIAEIHAGLIIRIQDRTPAAGKFVEGGLDQTRRPLRPRIEEGPGQRAGKAEAGFESKPAGRLRGLDQLIRRPALPFVRSASDSGWRESVEGIVIGRV